MRRYARALMALCGLLIVCVGLGGVHSGRAYADWCTSEYYDLKGDGYIHYRQHPCEIAVNEICHIWRVEDLALRKRVDAYNAHCAGTPERLIENPNNQRYHQQPLQQHHAQAHPPKGAVRGYDDAKRLVEKFPKDARKKGGGAEFQQTYIVNNGEELRALEQKLIFGLKPDRIINTPRGEIKMYKLPDGVDVKVKEGSRSGGRTIEIVPTHSSDDALKVHIKRGK